jgi:heavy metal sensor kinase
VKRTLGLRTRITVWYVLVLTAALAIYTSGTALLLHRHLYADLDRHLETDAELTLQQLHRDETTGALTWSGDPSFGELREGRRAGHWVEVWSASGRLLLADSSGTPLDLGPAPVSGPFLGPLSVSSPRGPMRVVTRPGRLGDEDLLVRVAVSEMPTRRLLAMLLAGLGVLFPLTAIGTIVGGMAIVRHALAPVLEMAHRARRLSAERLGERLPVEPNDDELSQLAGAFNDTLSRLEDSFERMRRFTSDASHELRTPLTALRSVGEVGITRAHSPEELREVVGSMLEEADRLTRLIDSLLQLSRADTGDIALTPEWTPVCHLACDAASRLSVLAEERGQTLSVDAGERLCVLVDRLMFRQALVNLIDNAIKYGPEDRPIRIAPRTMAGGLSFEVADEGPGIAPEHQAHVFDRFYRVDRGRSPGRGGFGLGLSLVRWVAEAHEGRAELDSSPGQRCCFRIVLPAHRVRTKVQCACGTPLCEELQQMRHQVVGCP